MLPTKLDEVDNTRILRRVIKLMDYNLPVDYIPDRQNKIADTFSGPPVNFLTKSNFEDANTHTFSVNTACLVKAEDTKGLFRLEKIKATTNDDIEYQILKNQVLQEFTSGKHKLSNVLHSYWQIKDDYQ